MQRIDLSTTDLHQALTRAANVLRAGGLVVYPTETLYGAGVAADNLEAVDKLITFKRRPAGKPISIMVAEPDMAYRYIEQTPQVETALERYLPGPVTVVGPAHKRVDERLSSEWDTIGIRISDHAVAHGLAREYGAGITATSANASGAPRPYTIETMLEHLSDKQASQIDLILDAGTLPKREPSTVIDVSQDVQQIIRLGSQASQLAKPFITASEEETQALAHTLMDSLKHALQEKPIVFLLKGDLGMGKTQFAKGIAQSLGIERPITSPSYTLMKEYPGHVADKAVRFLHLDCWRAASITAQDLGLPDEMRPGTVLAIEWPDPLLPYFRSLAHDVVLHAYTFEESKNHRTITLSEP